MSMKTPEALIDELCKMRMDADYFVRTALNAEPTPQQRQVLKSVCRQGAHISVRSGHGTGKTTLLSWLTLWFLLLHDDCRVPCTAPSNHQLGDLLWSEHQKWIERLDPFFRRDILLSTDKMMVRGAEKMRYAVARTARRENPEALQGFHATNLLFLIDEASGIDEKIFEVAEGALSTKGARVVMMSNPTRTDGYFYRSQTSERNLWDCYAFNCLKSSLVDEVYPKQMAEKYGEDSDIYRIRVLGEFPSGSADSLIALGDIETAVGRDIEPVKGTKRIAGLDVARFGDDATALVVRHSGVISHIEQWRNWDTMRTVGHVVEHYRAGLFDRVHVDSIGVGSGVVDRLREIGVPVVGVNVSEVSASRDKFSRLRDELWWKAKEFFEEKGCAIAGGLELSDDMISELSSVRYAINSTGKIKVEGKDEMKKRHVPSPNIADALCLTFVEGVLGGEGGNVLRKVEDGCSDGWT